LAAGRARWTVVVKLAAHGSFAIPGRQSQTVPGIGRPIAALAVAAAPAATVSGMTRLVQKNNAAVDELQAVVGRFNEQLKIFKAKQKAAS
jgi:hypothetical protein